MTSLLAAHLPPGEPNAEFLHLVAKYSPNFLISTKVDDLTGFLKNAASEEDGSSKIPTTTNSDGQVISESNSSNVTPPSQPHFTPEFQQKSEEYGSIRSQASLSTVTSSEVPSDAFDQLQEMKQEAPDASYNFHIILSENVDLNLTNFSEMPQGLFQEVNEEIFDSVEPKDSLEIEDFEEMEDPGDSEGRVDEEEKTSKAPTTKKHSCGVCNKSFSTRYAVTRHYRTHTGEAPQRSSMPKKYFCDVCDKSFPMPSDYKRHYRIHTGEKPYKCDVCQMDFVQQSSYSLHMRTHTGEKPFRCDQCGKCFSQANTLEYHVRIHTGEKPYQCEFCEKRFRSKGTMDRHVELHSGEKPFECRECDAKFAQFRYLKQHYNRMHS